MVADILDGIAKPLSRETFSLVLEMIRMDNLPVQKALRALLPELSQGRFAEELRQGLLAALTVVPAETAKPDERGRSRSPAGAAERKACSSQAKLEFKFRRENTQILTVFFIDIVGVHGEVLDDGHVLDLLKLIKAFEDIVTADHRRPSRHDREEDGGRDPGRSSSTR